MLTHLNSHEEALTRELPVPFGLQSRADSSPPTTPVREIGQDPMERQPSSRRFEGEKLHYNTGAHFIWIGDRTKQLTHAHIEHFRGIRNPIGCKVRLPIPFSVSRQRTHL